MSVASSAALGLLEERTLENFLNAGKDHIRQVFVPLGSGETLKERGLCKPTFHSLAFYREV